MSQRPIFGDLRSDRPEAWAIAAEPDHKPFDFVLFRSDEIERYLRAAGFEVERSIARDPYSPDVEHQSRRGYILARVDRNAPAPPAK